MHNNFLKSLFFILLSSYNISMKKPVCKNIFILIVLVYTSLFLWSNEPFALLKTGPEKMRDIGNIVKSQPNLYGEYNLRNTNISLWAAYSIISYGNEWVETDVAGIMYNAEKKVYSTRVELRNVELYMRDYLYWTLYFSFDDGLQTNDIFDFINQFEDRFTYFGSLAKQIGDVSFPAVIEAP